MTSTPSRPGPQVPIRSLREAHGLSIEELRDRIESHLGKKPHGDTLRNIELGRRNGSPALMAAWAKALTLHPLDVFQPDAKTTEKVPA